MKNSTEETIPPESESTMGTCRMPTAMAPERQGPKRDHRQGTLRNGNDGLSASIDSAALYFSSAVEQLDCAANVYQSRPAKNRRSVFPCVIALRIVGAVSRLEAPIKWNATGKRITTWLAGWVAGVVWRCILIPDPSPGGRRERGVRLGVEGSKIHRRFRVLLLRFARLNSP